MLKTLYSILVLIIFFITNTYPQFYDNFDSYIAGQQLVCQNPTDWTTWMIQPCNEMEDPIVSNAYSYSLPNSILNVQNNDLIKTLGSKTSGIWYINFLMLIPEGKGGYFNTIAGFTPNPYNWGMECYFDNLGNGSIYGGSVDPINFTYTFNTWHNIQVTVNLSEDIAQFWFDSILVHEWQWTLGDKGNGSPLRLDGVDFYGAYSFSEMYIDNFWFGNSPVSVETIDKVVLEFRLEQNYPNPFNPNTKIKFSSAEAGNIKLAVYNMLGEEIKIIVNGYKEAGLYDLILMPLICRVEPIYTD